MASGPGIFGLSRSDRGIVVFHLWQSLSYGPRLLLSFGLIISGFALQLVSGITGYDALLLIAGTVLIFGGNLFLLVKGYDNRVDQGHLDPRAQWEPVGIDKLRELVALDRRMGKWDTSILDVTNKRGFWAFIMVTAGLGAAILLAPGILRLLALDAALLLLPHWLTGTRRLLRLPMLMVKAEAILAVLETVGPDIEGWDLEVLMELRGKETQLPQDIKFRLMPANKDKATAVPAASEAGDFLGFYGQCSTNDVQGRSFPYFYTVLVAKKGYGLKQLFDSYKKPRGIFTDYDVQEEVETFVIRQSTDKKQGYHTNPVDAVTIFQAGLGQARLTLGGK